MKSQGVYSHILKKQWKRGYRDGGIITLVGGEDNGRFEKAPLFFPAPQL